MIVLYNNKPTLVSSIKIISDETHFEIGGEFVPQNATRQISSVVYLGQRGSVVYTFMKGLSPWAVVNFEGMEKAVSLSYCDINC